jgi:long-chain acyl-CoA synthetase
MEPGTAEQQQGQEPASAQASDPLTLSARTVCEAFQMTVEHFGEAPALRAFESDAPAITWAQFGERVAEIAAGLHGLGVRRGDTVAIMLVNRPEFHLVDCAAMHLGATPFSIYNTSAPGQIEYLFSDAGNRIVITEAQFVPALLEAKAKTEGFEHIVCIDGAPEGTIGLDEVIEAAPEDFDLDEHWRAVAPEDLVTLIYTSGTTGPPKGVQTSHANVMAELRCVHAAADSGVGGRIISWLPSAHIADRWGTYYSSIAYHREIVTLADTRAIVAALPAVRPTIFGSVPRIWEKMKAGIEAQLAGLPEEQRDQAQGAVAAAVQKVRLEQAGETVPAELAEGVAQAEAAMFAPLRERLGLDQTKWFVVGAAPTPREVMEFFLAIGIPICEVWGMSETTCVATLNPPDALKLGTVGKALPGVELKLAEDGELLCRGDIIMTGYRNHPDTTAEAIDGDGWLHTGDVAEIDDEGYVKIVDRKKELIINAAGKNMSPANIEARLKSSSPLIGQAICIGDARPYNSALLVLDPDAAAAYASEHGLEDASAAAMAADEDVRTAIETAVQDANSHLSRVEQIKRWVLLPVDWEPGGDELTPTMKLKRKPIAEKYAEEIAGLYA